ncbi:MAG TPA: 6,7-dimethyl-8-ribityllumazine synthase, partial [Fimbriimonadaceae bacterium]|nr:6,7-dimethyl-8-ribityllumazine synthase [Fimbriimonadaceae bacterium]
MSASGRRFAVVVSRWNELITKELLAGAMDELQRHDAKSIEVVHVPGTWEIPVAVQALLARPASNRPHGVVALGCILQGATSHAALLAADVSSALMRIQTDSGVPVTWGVLTPENQEQALERSGLKLGNKGR